MNPRALVMMLVAIVCGLAAMFGANRMLARKEAPAVETQEILVAARDLKAEEVLQPDAVKLATFPKANVPPGSFVSARDLEDRWLTTNLLEGEPIVERKLALKGMPAGLVARIPKGLRAFALDVNEQSGVSGFILPEHRVDVVMSRQSGSGESREAETILEDVQVLAVGQVFNRADDRTIEARTVTLAVTPEQVDVLVAARARGTLTLSLRGVNDHDRAKKPSGPSVLARLADALGKMKPAPVKVAAPPPPPPAREVEPPPPPPAPRVAPPQRPVLVHRGPNRVQVVRFGQMSPEAQVTEPAEPATATIGGLSPLLLPGVGASGLPPGLMDNLRGPGAIPGAGLVPSGGFLGGPGRRE